MKVGTEATELRDTTRLYYNSASVYECPVEVFEGVCSLLG